MTGPGYSESYTNDAYGRRVTQAVSSDASYQVDFAYNALGTLDALTYPTSTFGYRLKLQYEYTNGIVTAIKDFNAPATVIWRRTANDARGAVIDETLGSNLQVVTGRDPLTGRMDYRQAGVGGGSAVQNLAWLYDVNDNVTQRGDANQAGSCSVGGVGAALCETFSYDSLERLTTVHRNGTLTLQASYDLSGNLTSRSDVGSYTYHATQKHALSTAGAHSFSYDANGNVISRDGATLGWASYDLPTALAAGSNTASFAYTPQRQRWQQVAVSGGSTETTLYVGGILEKVTKDSLTLWKHYVIGPTGLGALYIRRSNGTADTYYLTGDHLGSTDRIVRAATGAVQVAASFDAFGQRRANHWAGGPSSAELAVIGKTTRAGFTGHEMLDGVGLIHMNGRVYDPAVGRFLSVDPRVRDSAASQSWNGYGYVEARLLSATDPSGWETVDCPQCVQYRADPPRSAWVTAAYSTFQQTTEVRVDPLTGLEVVVVTGHWSFSGPNSLLGLRDLPLRTGEVAAPSQTVNEDAEKDERLLEPCTGLAEAVQELTGGDNGLGRSAWLDSTASNYDQTMDYDFMSLRNLGVGPDTLVAAGSAPFVASTWGGVTPGQAVSQIMAAGRAAIRTPGLIGIRTPLSLAATVGVSWAGNAVLANVIYRGGVVTGSALRAAVNQLATYACANRD